MLTPEKRSRSSPSSTSTACVAASFNPDDGVVFPWPFCGATPKPATKLGVDVSTFTDVVGFDTTGRRIDAVRHQPRARSERTKVVNAAGAWSPEVARLLGVELPNRPHRHEICSTEPLKPWLAPLVADLANGLYFSQSTRGEIVGGISDDRVPQGIDQTLFASFSRRSTRARSPRRARSSGR